jgi:hypothetical protein
MILPPIKTLVRPARVIRFDDRQHSWTKAIGDFLTKGTHAARKCRALVLDGVVDELRKLARQIATLPQFPNTTVTPERHPKLNVTSTVFLRG